MEAAERGLLAMRLDFDRNGMQCRIDSTIICLQLHFSAPTFSSSVRSACPAGSPSRIRTPATTSPKNTRLSSFFVNSVPLRRLDRLDSLMDKRPSHHLQHCRIRFHLLAAWSTNQRCSLLGPSDSCCSGDGAYVEGAERTDEC